MLNFGLLLLRLAVGLTVAAHGGQKLFGWWDGPGIEGWTKGVRSMGLRPVLFWTGTSALAEFGGGLLLAVGLLTPIAVAAIVAGMAMAILQAHWPRFFNAKGGSELPVVISASALAVGFAGPGAWSLDSAYGLQLPEPASLIIAVVLGLLGVVAARLSRRLPAQAASTPQQRAA